MPVKPDRYAEWLGIPDGPRPPDHYALLGIQRFEPDTGVVERAAIDRLKRIRQYCMKYAAEGTQLLNEITKARMCLLNAEDRATYDTLLRSASLPIASASRSISPPIAAITTLQDLGWKVVSEDVLSPASPSSNPPPTLLVAQGSNPDPLAVPAATNGETGDDDAAVTEEEWDALLRDWTKAAALKVKSNFAPVDAPSRKSVVVVGVAVLCVAALVIGVVASRNDQPVAEVVFVPSSTLVAETAPPLTDDDSPTSIAAAESTPESPPVEFDGLSGADVSALQDLLARIERQKKQTATSTLRWATVVSELVDLSKKHPFQAKIRAMLAQSQTLLNESFRGEFEEDWADAVTDSARTQVLNSYFAKPEAALATDALKDLVFATLIADLYGQSRAQTLNVDLRALRFAKAWNACGEPVPPPIAFKSADVRVAMQRHVRAAYSEEWNRLETLVKSLDSESDFADALNRVEELDVEIPMLVDAKVEGANLNWARQVIASRVYSNWASYRNRVGDTAARSFCEQLKRHPTLDRLRLLLMQQLAQSSPKTVPATVPTTTTTTIPVSVPDDEPGVSRPFTYDEVKSEIDRAVTRDADLGSARIITAMKKAFPIQTQEAGRAYQRALIRDRTREQCYYAIMVGPDKSLEAWGYFHAGYVIAKALSANDLKKPPKVLIGCGRTIAEARTHLDAQLDPKGKRKVP